MGSIPLPRRLLLLISALNHHFLKTIINAFSSSLHRKMSLIEFQGPRSPAESSQPSIPEKSFGLIFGRSGSGKTTLLQLIAGLSKPTSGSIYVQRYSDDGEKVKSPEPLQPERVGIVFQFPERYFCHDNVLDEVTFGVAKTKGWHTIKRASFCTSKGHYLANAGRACPAIQLVRISPMKTGSSCRPILCAFVQTPDLLLMSLAGLDWKARADVAKLLKHLKKELTLLVVSHDLKSWHLGRSILEDGNGRCT
ncbi:hypothetical protein HAX54_007248 [Datura stramonium]|uniref:ABC transporter domain-containing protein n=1 Tax=Datura stramonium TaxID=4076 RepID=A0ABS8TBG0_DATST|nr:hypothetical protein [Datura stramonium]